ncbi:hypothetical protein GCM10009696_36420 [Kocuria himachalensis]
MNGPSAYSKRSGVSHARETPAAPNASDGAGTGNLVGLMPVYPAR